MEGAAADLAAALADQLLYPPQHLLCSAPGERDEQNCFRGNPTLDQSRSAIDKSARLARTGSGNYQQRAVTVDDCGKLLRIQDVSVAEAEPAFVGLSDRRSAFKNNQLVGHDGPSLAQEAVAGS